MAQEIAGGTGATPQRAPSTSRPSAGAWFVLIGGGAVLAAILVALLNGGFTPGAKWLEGSRPSTEREYVAKAGAGGASVTFYGNPTILRDVSLNLPAAMNGVFERAVLQAAAASAEARYDAAIVHWAKIASVAPMATVLNNLGAAYAAAGEMDEALACFDKASQTNPRLPEIRRNAAVLGAARGAAGGAATGAVAGAASRTAFSPRRAGRGWVASRVEGVTARITRFSDSGGMLTLEVTFLNTSTDPAEITLEPWRTYLLDERRNLQRGAEHSSGTLSVTLKPGEQTVQWSKFLRPKGAAAGPYSVVDPNLQTPIENVSPG